MIGIILAALIGAAAGFGFMFWVATAMVDKVKANEEKRHQVLLSHSADIAGEWQDKVNDILDAIHGGAFENRSVKDQAAIVRRIVKGERQD